MKPHLRPIQRNVLSAYLYTLILVLFSTSVIAQQTTIDSLEHWIKTYPKRDTVYIKKLIELEKKYYVHQPQKIGKYANDILKLSKQSNYFFGVANGYTRLIHYYIQKGNYQVAIKTAYEKLKYVEKSKDYFEISNVYSLLGYIYSLIGNQDEKSIKNYELAYNYTAKLPLSDERRSRRLAGDLSNLALVYTKVGNNKKALSVLMKANKIVHNMPNKDNEYYYLLSAIQNNLANSYYMLNNYQLSNYYLVQTLSMVHKYQLKVSLKRVYLSLVRNYIELKQFEKASEYFMQLEKLNEENELDIEDKVLFLKFKTQLKEGEKNFQEAYLSLKEEGILKDSLNKEEQQKAIQELTIKYETDQKELKIKQLQQEKELSEFRNKITTISALALLVILIGGGVAYWQVRKAKQKAEAISQLKNKLFSIIAHDLRSPAHNLKDITSTAKYVAKSKEPQQVNNLLSSVSKSAITLSNLVDNLLHWSLLQQNTLAIEPVEIIFADEILILTEEYAEKIKSKNLTITAELDNKIISIADRITSQIILRNLLDNALKFTPNGGEITCWLVEEANYTHLHIADTGIGITTDKQGYLFEPAIQSKKQAGVNGEKGTGIGLYLCRELARLNKGNLELVESTPNKGSHFVLTLPSV